MSRINSQTGDLESYDDLYGKGWYMTHTAAELKAALAAKGLCVVPVYFPILGYADHEGCPQSFPWMLLAPCERQAQKNHSQTLERLAKRGGLDPLELLAVLEGRDKVNATYAEAVQRIRAMLAAQEAE